jgi:hypothetical protein
MNKETSDGQFADVQRLLAYKRTEMPSEDYFHGILFEFHQRQRSALLKPAKVSLLQHWWTDLIEILTVHPSRALRYAMGLTLSVGLLGFSLNMGRVAPGMASSQPVMPAVEYAFTQAPATMESVDQQIDAAILKTASGDKQAMNTHYVLNDTATLDEAASVF